MTEWGHLTKAAPRIDNHPKAMNAMVAIRRWLLSEVDAEHAVLDLYAGSGSMYRAAWRDAALYRGCDKKFFRDSRIAYVIDNMRLVRAIDLAPFNVFDLDAHGSPWSLITIIAARRPLGDGETIGLALTDGSQMKSRFGELPFAIADLAAVSRTLPGAHRDWESLTHAPLAGTARRKGGELIDPRAVSGRASLYSGALIGRRGPGTKKAPEAEAAGARCDYASRRLSSALRSCQCGGSS